MMPGSGRRGTGGTGSGTGGTGSGTRGVTGSAGGSASGTGSTRVGTGGTLGGVGGGASSTDGKGGGKWESVKDIERLRDQLLKPRINLVEREVAMDKYDIQKLLSAARRSLLSEQTLLELQPPINIIGDIHGQYADLLDWLAFDGHPPNTRYLFLGDYVDRGGYSIEVMCLLLCFKVLHPDAIYLLRGNHETFQVSQIYGFYDQVKRRYGISLYRRFVDVFNVLPIAAIISDRIFCCHGGLSPHLQSMSQIKQIPRPADIPEKGLACDLVWSDPAQSIQDYQPSDRGVSYLFGAQVVKNFVNQFGFELVCRAHQVVEDGYEFFADQKLITIFSAPNYCGEFDNAGAMLRVDRDLTCRFQILEPNKKRKERLVKTSVPPNITLLMMQTPPATPQGMTSPPATPQGIS